MGDDDYDDDDDLWFMIHDIDYDQGFNMYDDDDSWFLCWYWLKLQDAWWWWFMIHDVDVNWRFLRFLVMIW